MIESAKIMEFQIEKYLSSPIEGKDGNKEFFLFLSK
jgi:predicted rRNA methylase YqxC with S4 and FtsJ domains